MQVHNLRISKKKSGKRIGRGGKKGTYSGRGMKGQKSRSGYSKRATFEGGMSSLVARTKKIRGKGFKPKIKNQIVNLGQINDKFKAAQKVSAVTLCKKGLARKGKGPVKILSKGELTKGLIFEKLAFSKAALEKIKKSKSEIVE